MGGIELVKCLQRSWYTASQGVAQFRLPVSSSADSNPAWVMDVYFVTDQQNESRRSHSAM